MYFMSEDMQPLIEFFKATGIFPYADVNMGDHNSFYFADDAAYAFHLEGQVSEHKDILKKFLWMLSTVSQEWGLKIDWTKSAIMCMLRPLEAPSSLSDVRTKFEGKGIERQALLTLTINNEVHDGFSTDDTIRIPLVKSYKYLGINIHWNLSFDFHLRKIKDKINYITNSFIAIRRASENVKFCHNTWTTFIRPLLDYSIIYSYYTGESGREKLHVLYRNSLRQMLFLKTYTPITIAEKLLQYNYRNLYTKAIPLIERKITYRKERITNDDLLNEKLDFEYNKKDLTNLKPKMIKLIHTYYTRGECKEKCPKYNRKPHGPKHWQQHIDQDHPEFGNIEKTILDYIDNVDNSSYDHNLVMNKIDKVILYLINLIAVKGGRNLQS